MKTNQYLLTVILMASALVSCGNTVKTLYEDNSIVAVETVDDYGGYSRITKNLDLKYFHGFKLNSYVDVNYTEGSSYKVTVSGPARLMSNTVIKVSNGLLEVGLLHDNNVSDYNNEKICLTVTAPRIDFIENSGISTFTSKSVSVKGDISIENSGSLHFQSDKMFSGECRLLNTGIMRYYGELSASNVNINNSGSFNVVSRSMCLGGIFKANNSGILKLNVGSLECDVFNMSNSGSVNCEGHVAARQMISVENDGVYKSKSDCEVKGVMILKNSGSSDFSGSVKAREYKCKISGISKDKLAVKADSMHLDINGSGKINMNFSGGNVDMKCSGVCNVDMNLDCRKIKAVNNGSATVALAGTADEFVLDGNGFSNINTKGLNRF